MLTHKKPRALPARVGAALALSLLVATLTPQLVTLESQFQSVLQVAPPIAVTQETPEVAESTRKAAITDYLAVKYRKEPDTVRTYVDLAWQEALRHRDVSPELILAVIQKESSLRTVAESSFGAKGLMQVVPRYHTEKIRAKESLTDARVNIRVGAEILQEYLSQAGGDLPRALRRYSGNARGYADFIKQAKATLERI